MSGSSRPGRVIEMTILFKEGPFVVAKVPDPEDNEYLVPKTDYIAQVTPKAPPSSK